MIADTCIDIFIVSLDCKLTRLSVGIFSELRILIKIYLSTDMGQAAHSAGQVIFEYHLPRDKFCQKYLWDPKSTIIHKEHSQGPLRMHMFSAFASNIFCILACPVYMFGPNWY